MIESNPIQGWQDETLALKIEELFHKLKTLVSAGKMPHYFMRKSNMLAGVPQHKLQNVSERIYRIRENFVFFLINILKVRSIHVSYSIILIFRVYFKFGTMDLFN